MTFTKLLAGLAAAGTDMGPAYGMTAPYILLHEQAFGPDPYRN